jgi:EmrB/QacA subfamily drug resistance transporter
MARLWAGRAPQPVTPSSGTTAPTLRGGPSLALGVLCTLLFLTFLDSTIVSVALGDIQHDLHADVGGLQWVLAGYTLTFASIMLACGMIGDELGRKKVMLTGAAVFCAGSVVCAVAPNVQTLIAGRMVMGLGAAASEPGTLSMLRHLYPDERTRSRAIGVWVATCGFALAAGPVIGGILVGLWSWRGIFWFNVAFGLAALLVALIILPENSDPTAARVDTAGTLLGAGALATLVAAIIEAETLGYRNWAVILLLCASVVLTALFIGWERKAAYPLLDLRYFKVPAFATGNIAAFCTYFATFAIYFFVALYLVEVVGASGYRLALVFAPMTVLMIISSLYAGRWSAVTGHGVPVAIGCAIFAAGLFSAGSFIGIHPNYVGLSLVLALAGIGIGITVVPITSAVMSAVPAERSGMAASAANTSRVMGAATGVAILGSLVNSQLHSNLVARMDQLAVPKQFQSEVITALETGQIPRNVVYPPAIQKEVNEVIGAAYTAFQDGLNVALYLSGSLALLAGLLALIMLRDRGSSSAESQEVWTA